jgi:transcriptional regulator with XRE-family HTH domain
MGASELKNLRDWLGLTQSELAEVLGVHRVSLAKWETGEHHVPKSAARLLKRMLDRRRPIKLAYVLREAALDARTWAWFEGRVPRSDPTRGAATKELVRWGFIEKLGGPGLPHGPQQYRATKLGREFLKANGLDTRGWPEHVDEITFPEL